MELGVCSCIKGYAGAACKYQAAVAKNFTIPAVNLPPFHAKEARRLYAILARGQSKVMEIKFYNDLREESSEEEDISFDNSNNDECDDNFSPVSSENADDITDISVNNSSTSTMMLTSKQIQDYKQALYGIVDDITERLADGDQNMVSGVTKFIKSYAYMQNLGIAPSSTISYALHNFGKPDSKLPILMILLYLNLGYVWSNGRRGRYVKTNATGIK